MAKRGAKKGVKRRKPSQIARLKADIARLSLENKTQIEIAEELSTEEWPLSQQMVSEYLSQLKAEWNKQALESLDSKKSHELAKLHHLEKVYWEAWYRSISKMEESTAKKERADTKGEKEQTEIKRFSTSGDPRYLGGILSCIAERNKINGIVSTSNKFINFNFDASDPKFTEEDLAMIAKDGESALLMIYANKAGRNN